MIKKKYNISVWLFILLGLIFSSAFLLRVETSNGLHFYINHFIDSSIIDIAISKSEEKEFNSTLIGIIFYILALILIINHSKKKINFLLLFFLLLILIFEIYCIYLVKIEKFHGQHLRISVPIFFMLWYVFEESKKNNLK